MMLKRKGNLLIFAAFSIFVTGFAILFINILNNDFSTSRAMRLNNDSYLLGEWISESFSFSSYFLTNIINRVPVKDIHYPPENNEQYQSYTREINKIRSTLPYAVFSGIIDHNGILSHSSSVDGFDFSDQPFFKEIINHPERNSIISNAFKSPEGYFQIAQGLNFETDTPEFHAMAIIAYELGFFSKWIEKLEGQNTSIITIIDQNGIILAQNSSDKTIAGKRYQTLPLDTILSTDHDYQVIFKNPVTDSKKSVYAVRRIVDLPFYVIIEEINSLRTILFMDIIMVLFALLIIHLLAVFVLNSHLTNIRITTEMEQTASELKTIFNFSMVGIILINGDRKVVRANQRFAEIVGVDTPEVLVGRDIKDFHISDENYNAVDVFYRNELEKKETVEMEYEFKRIDGHNIWVRIIGSTIDQQKSSDLTKGIIWIVDDITERREAKQKLVEMATKDQLTGLYNRHCFIDLGNRELSIFDRSKRPVSIIMIDIDHFKSVNDTYGHSVGDKALIFFAKICMENIRAGDIPGRMGGEEFAVLLPDTQIDKAFQVAERIRLNTEKSTADNQEGLPYMTVSIGVAEIGEPPDLMQALKSADTAMYNAKSSGRNRVMIFSADKKAE